MVNKNVIYSLSDNMCCHDEVTQLLSSQETFLRKNYAVTELFFGRFPKSGFLRVFWSF